MKAWWNRRTQAQKWAMAMVASPVMIAVPPLILLGLVLIMAGAPIVDALDDWSKP